MIIQIRFRKSKQARKLKLQLSPFKGIEVVVPQHISLREARIFAEKNRNWIEKNLIKVKLREEEILKKKESLEKIDIKNAKNYLQNRLKYLAQKHKLTYQKVFIRNQKTRWGSCSSKNNINLNINLIRVPNELCDYVILHELAHLVHKNHSEKFWKFLDSLLDENTKKLDKELKNYGWMIL